MLNYRSWLRWLPFVLTMGLILYLSHLPGNRVHLPRFHNSDKLIHVGAYCTLGLSFLYALSPRWRWRSLGRAGVSVVSFCFLFGLTDEFHQSFVPGRTVSSGDVLADVVGGVMAWGLYACWQWFRNKRCR